MTIKLGEAFPSKGGIFRIEPDASSGTYFIAARHLIRHPEHLEYSERFGIEVATEPLSTISVDWPRSGWQVDEGFDWILAGSPLLLGMRLTRSAKTGDALHSEIGKHFSNLRVSRSRDLGDSIMMAIVLSPYSLNPS